MQISTSNNVVRKIRAISQAIRKEVSVDKQHRLNMEVDLRSLFGLHVTWCAQLYSLAKNPATPHLPPHLGSYYEGRKERRHLFVTPWLAGNEPEKIQKTIGGASSWMWNCSIIAPNFWKYLLFYHVACFVFSASASIKSGLMNSFHVTATQRWILQHLHHKTDFTISSFPFMRKPIISRKKHCIILFFIFFIIVQVWNKLIIRHIS